MTVAAAISPVRRAGLVAIFLCAGLSAAADAPQTTVPVYLPGYDPSAWKALRGSVIKSVWESCFKPRRCSAPIRTFAYGRIFFLVM